MSENQPQTYANHRRMDPFFHYFLTPVLLICFIWSIVFIFHRANALHIWLAVFSLTALLVSLNVRRYSLKVQDRVIRLEEKLRLTALLPQNLRARVGDLTEPQLIALRFASDDEIPVLVDRVLRENLDPKAIKQAIEKWRPDYFRI